jgi:hypothetical protein
MEPEVAHEGNMQHNTMSDSKPASKKPAHISVNAIKAISTK